HHSEKRVPEPACVVSPEQDLRAVAEPEQNAATDLHHADGTSHDPLIRPLAHRWPGAHRARWSSSGFGRPARGAARSASLDPSIADRGIPSGGSQDDEVVPPKAGQAVLGE